MQHSSGEPGFGWLCCSSRGWAETGTWVGNYLCRARRFLQWHLLLFQSPLRSLVLGNQFLWKLLCREKGRWSTRWEQGTLTLQGVASEWNKIWNTLCIAPVILWLIWTHFWICLPTLLPVTHCKIHDKLRNGKKDSETLSAVLSAGFTGSFEAELILERKSETLRWNVLPNNILAISCTKPVFFSV